MFAALRFVLVEMLYPLRTAFLLAAPWSVPTMLSTSEGASVDDIVQTIPEAENTPPEGAFVDDIVQIIPVAGDNPRGASWADSYSVGDECFMYTNFDHDIGDVVVDTPMGSMTIRDLFDELGPGPGADGRPLYNDIQCGNGPPNSHRINDEINCPGLVEFGPDGCGQIGPMWNLSELA